MRIERQEVISNLITAMIEDKFDLIDKLTEGFIGYASYSDKMLQDEFFEVFDEKITIVND
jgi:hypothetical protein